MFDRIHRLRRGAAVASMVVLATTVLSACGNDNDQNSLEPKGENAQKILDLFTPFFWVALVIGVGVVGGTIYVAVRFRERPGEERAPKQTHGNTVLEVGWTIVPALILAVMAAVTIPTIFDLAEEPPDDALKINVIAKQWFWEYEYCVADAGDDCEGDEEVDFITANEMHIPVGEQIELQVGAPEDGVIHSFWVPSLNGKKDAVPGRFESWKIQAEEPGTYLGQCAEYCGLSHADMRLRVIAQTPEDFRAWQESQREGVSASAAEFITENMSVDDAPAQSFSCTRCHAFGGVEGAGARIGPDLTHVGDRSTFASGLYETDVENLTKWVYDAPGQKEFGKYVNRMPSFRHDGMTEETAAEIAKFLLCETATDQSQVPQEVRDKDCA